MKQRTSLLVSLNFPPSSIASVHRARHLAKHLPEFGWRPIVLAVDEKFHKEPVDFALGRLVPETVDVRRVRALPVKLGKLLGVGDLALRSMFQVWHEIKQLVKAEQPDVVFFTGWPFYQMLLTSWIRCSFGLPVVLDFQDPWVSAEGSSRPKWSKGGAAHRLAVALEPRAIRDASYITSVSDRQNDEMAARYSWLDRARMAAVPIGGDPDDFTALRRNPPVHPQVRLDPGKINFSFVGAFMPRTGPAARTVFRALAQVRRSHPELAARIRFNFVGTSNQPNGYGAFQVAPLAVEEGVGDLVHETPQRVAYLEALSLLANSHALLLIGSDEPHYTASKIYPALMSGRPYLSIFHQASSSHQILSGAGGGESLAFAGQEELAELEPALGAAIVRLASDAERYSPAKPESWSDYHASSVARRFAEIFASVGR
ncbi:hypothetical protein M2323_002163 [Rhodoblastus acidophilus]|uniref:glycosyltransferase n=1 Tax=Rhodoblastus acidophilus TaxID=1074 RepID=UPI002224EA75|nr:glycosyltransferase [Rhodoblastus acidophilus]MCW2284288.1 hypothetical protein [Rhodoblastus acidophilus]MCW2333234.1 hypothetical protein [Rhodoblastus acidophilus]